MLGFVAASSSDDGSAAFAVLVLLGLYLLPTVIAVIRKMPNAGSIIVINLLLGWTVIGWIVALAMALGSPQRGGSVTVNNVISNYAGGAAPPADRSIDPGTPTATGRWSTDPFGRFKHRYFDGVQWTAHVSNGPSEQRTDEPVHAPPPSANSGWNPDPFNRFKHRYFNGVRWTENVSDHEGTTRTDPPVYPNPTDVPPPPPDDTFRASTST